MNRRSFLKIAGAAGLLTVTPISIASALATKVPVIYGDGIHDDSDGLEAALNGKDFVCAKNLVVREGNNLVVSNGNFLLNKGLTFSDTLSSVVRNCHFKFVPAEEGAALFTVRND